jgi:hypothetical protein
MKLWYAIVVVFTTIILFPLILIKWHENDETLVETFVGNVRYF